MSSDFIHTEENGIKYLVHPKGSIFEGIKIRENPDDAFKNAIKRGMKNPNDWMYMYSDKNKDFFKHHYLLNIILKRKFSISILAADYPIPSLFTIPE